ncbi:hypothetical protein FOCC_FOCC012233 [Frankliniella occidentalis]|nr:hypothetical protein FOCC_FOCC012233 [Frankliniella occidentalis]
MFSPNNQYSFRRLCPCFNYPKEDSIRHPTKDWSSCDTHPDEDSSLHYSNADPSSINTNHDSSLGGKAQSATGMGHSCTITSATTTTS